MVLKRFLHKIGLASAAPLNGIDGARDRDYLPAGVALIETPPSPIAVMLVRVVAALVVFLLAWGFWGDIDIVAIAQGKVQSVGRVKIIQASEAGRIKSLLVRNGQKVAANEPLAILDDHILASDEADVAQSLMVLNAEILRRRAAIGAVSGSRFTVIIDWPAAIAQSVRDRMDSVVSSELASLSAMLDSLKSQRLQKEAEQRRLADVIESQEKQLGFINDRVQIRSVLEKSQVGTKLNLLETLESSQQQQTVLSQSKGQLAENIAFFEMNEREQSKLVLGYLAEQKSKLADAEKQYDENAQKLQKIRERRTDMVVRAPVSGVVEGLTLVSHGQFVSAGEDIMHVVPDEGGLEIECYIANKDLTFIEVGQEVFIKFDAYPFARYGGLVAKVTRVGQDAVALPDLAQIENNAARSVQSKFIGGSQRYQNLHFPIVVQLGSHPALDHGKFPVLNGMTVSVEIKTGRRRLIDLIISPMVEVASTAFKQR